MKELTGKIVSCDHGLIIVDNGFGGVCCEPSDLPEGLKLKKGDHVEYENGDHHGTCHIIGKIEKNQKE